MRRKAATGRKPVARSPAGRAGRKSISPPLLIAAAAAVLVIIGSLVPWARVSTEAYVGTGVGGVTVRGTAVDGVITLALGALAAGLLAWRLARPQLPGYVLAVALVLLFTSGVVATTNWLDLANGTGDFSSDRLPAAGLGYIRTGVGVAWGLIITTAASWAGVAAGAYQLRNEHFR